MEKYNIIVFVQKGGRDLPSKLIMKGITYYLKELKKTMHVATLASSPLLTWSFFRLSKGYEC